MCASLQGRPIGRQDCFYLPQIFKRIEMKLKLVCKAIAIFAAIAFAGCETIDPLEPGMLVPKTVDQDPSLPSISVNNTLLHSETFGNPDSAMVVVLHGGPGGDYRSLLNCQAFTSNGYFVVFYDQRGAGLSKRHDKDVYSIQSTLDDLTAVIEHYRSSVNQKVFFIGHSWGAMLATAYINAYPVSVNGAVLAEPGGFTWKDTEDYLSRSNKITILSEETSDAVYFDQIFTGKENEHEILDYKAQLLAAFENAKGNTIGNAGQYPFWRSGAVTSNAYFEIADRDGFNWTTNLTQFTPKVLFMYSELNTAYGLQHAQRVSSAYSNVQLEKVNGTGHELLYFGWNNLNKLVIFGG